MAKINVLVIIFVFFAIGLYSQSIRNTAFKQDGNDIIVTYSLSIPYERIVNVELYVSLDGGRTFSGPLKAVSGDVGEINFGGEKSITWNVFEEYEKLEGNVSFEVRAKLKKLQNNEDNYADFQEKENLPIKTGVLSYNISGTSFLGVSFGFMNKFGPYMRLKSNASFADSDSRYRINNGDITYVNSNEYYNFTGQIKRSRFGVTVGMLHKLNRYFVLYYGLGYGMKNLLWEFNLYDNFVDASKYRGWAKHLEYSHTGIELETGMQLRIKNMFVSVGINTINFSFYEINGGIGFYFGL